jgi:lipocalin-like protein
MSNDQTHQHLLGTWKLVAAVREDIPSGSKTDLLGANPTGYINYAPDGRMMVLNVGSGRRKPAGANATPTEAEALFRSMTSYAGTYSVDGNEITHHVDVSWNESWTGTRQKRFARFEGDRVYLSTPPSPDPLTGTMSVRTMTWEKVS